MKFKFCGASLEVKMVYAVIIIQDDDDKVLVCKLFYVNFSLPHRIECNASSFSCTWSEHKIFSFNFNFKGEFCEDNFEVKFHGREKLFSIFKTRHFLWKCEWHREKIVGGTLYELVEIIRKIFLRFREELLKLDFLVFDIKF